MSFASIVQKARQQDVNVSAIVAQFQDMNMGAQEEKAEIKEDEAAPPVASIPFPVQCNIKFLRGWRVDVKKLPKYQDFKNPFVLDVPVSLLQEIHMAMKDTLSASQDKMMYNLIASVNRDQLTIRHEQAGGVGRFYPHGTSIIGLPRRIKHTIFSALGWIDIDMKKGHPTIIREIARANKSLSIIPAIVEYLDDPTAMFRRLIETYNPRKIIADKEGIPILDESGNLQVMDMSFEQQCDAVKGVFNIAIYGGGFSTWTGQMREKNVYIENANFTHPTIKRFIDNCATVSKLVNESNPDLVALAKINVAKKYQGEMALSPQEFNEKVTKYVMSYFCQAIENEIVYEYNKFLVKQGAVKSRVNQLPEYDGICFKPLVPVSKIDEIIAKGNVHVRQSSGLSVQMVFKAYRPEHVRQDIIDAWRAKHEVVVEVTTSDDNSDEARYEEVLSQKLRKGELYASQVRETREYKEYRAVFEGEGEGQLNIFKCISPVGFVRVVTTEKGREVQLRKKPDFLVMMQGWSGMPSFPVLTSNCVSHRSFVDLWLDDQDKRVYEGFVFDPTEKENTKYYNCFPGFINKCPSVLPMTDAEFAESAMGQLMAHLFEHERELEYVKCWFAHILQKPNVKTKVAMVLYTKTKGVGKNLLVDFMCAILGKALCAHLNDLEDIYKNFNAHLANKLLIYGDEIRPNQRNSADKLKQVITRPALNLEKKGVDAIEMEDFANYIFTTNNETAFHVEEGDRRLLMIHGREMRTPQELVAKCVKEMNCVEDLQRLFSYFAHHSQSEESVAQHGDFGVGSTPAIETKYKRELTYHTLPAYIQMFYRNPGRFAGYSFTATELYNVSLEYASKHHLTGNYTTKMFGTEVLNLFANAKDEWGKPIDIRKRTSGGMKYTFPELVRLQRVLFEKNESFYRFVHGYEDGEMPNWEAEPEDDVPTPCKALFHL